MVAIPLSAISFPKITRLLLASILKKVTVLSTVVAYCNVYPQAGVCVGAGISIVIFGVIIQ